MISSVNHATNLTSSSVLWPLTSSSVLWPLTSSSVMWPVTSSSVMWPLTSPHLTWFIPFVSLSVHSPFARKCSFVVYMFSYQPYINSSSKNLIVLFHILFPLLCVLTNLSLYAKFYPRFLNIPCFFFPFYVPINISHPHPLLFTYLFFVHFCHFPSLLLCHFLHLFLTHF